MSKATKRKHVTKEVLDEFVVPDNMHQIVKVNNASFFFFFPETVVVRYSGILVQRKRSEECRYIADKTSVQLWNMI